MGVPRSRFGHSDRDSATDFGSQSSARGASRKTSKRTHRCALLPLRWFPHILNRRWRIRSNPFASGEVDFQMLPKVAIQSRNLLGSRWHPRVCHAINDIIVKTGAHVSERINQNFCGFRCLSTRNRDGDMFEDSHKIRFLGFFRCRNRTVVTPPHAILGSLFPGGAELRTKGCHRPWHFTCGIRSSRR